MVKLRPICCNSDKWQETLPLYICALGEKPFREQPKPEQDFLIKSHRHFTTCPYCREGYIGIMQKFLPEMYRDKIALIGRNRIYLNELLEREDG